MFKDIFPSADEALALEPEELGVFLLRHLAEMEAKSTTIQFGNYFSEKDVLEYCKSVPDRKVKRAITEAWIWLEKEGMIAPLIEHGRDWVYITKRGSQLLKEQNWESYHRGQLLRNAVLTPSLARKVLPMFMRGDYESAVFQAFKEVEVQVRKAGSLPNSLIGVALMRQAFKVEDGPLSGSTSDRGEQEAISNLFAGAIGLFKNPSSHRDVEWEDPQEATEAILFANFLLRVMDRAAKPQDKPQQ